MWTVKRTELPSRSGEKAVIVSDRRILSFGKVIEAWRDDEAFREFFIAALATSPFIAFFWETPPVRKNLVDIDYGHVAIRGDALARMCPDPHAFQAEFHEKGSTSVATFRNLGGDAVLVAPRPDAELECYGHLGAFVRMAPAEQRHELFRTLAVAVEDVLATTGAPIWISTSGLGVPWLHIRIDTYPKYYNYRPYTLAQ